MRKVLLFVFVFLLGTGVCFSRSAEAYDYVLYKNVEDYGILIFPKDNSFHELDDFIRSLNFKEVSSGKAVMRYGSKRENETFMMPQDVQKKLNIEKFITLQVLANRGILIGIFDPEWGLTLPTPIHDLDSIKEKIPKTLQVFRGKNKGKTIHWEGGKVIK